MAGHRPNEKIVSHVRARPDPAGLSRLSDQLRAARDTPVPHFHRPAPAFSVRSDTARRKRRHDTCPMGRSLKAGDSICSVWSSSLFVQRACVRVNYNNDLTRET